MWASRQCAIVAVGLLIVAWEVVDAAGEIAAAADWCSHGGAAGQLGSEGDDSSCRVCYEEPVAGAVEPLVFDLNVLSAA